MSQRIRFPRFSSQGQWSSRLSFVLAATGAAVGLGNIWKFPYMVGNYGGSAFLFVYLCCLLLIGLPVMLAEILVGRCGRQNSVNSLCSLAQEAGTTEHWQYLGWWGAAALLLVLSFYSVVAGWSLGYLFHAVQGSFMHLDASAIRGLWFHFLSHPLPLLFWHTLFMIMTLGVVALGIHKGLERANKAMMPLLLIILLLLVGYAVTTEGFSQGAAFLYDFNWYQITPSVVIAAMGHALFTLAVGAGCMLVYGAYLPEKTPIISTVFVIAGLNLAVALLTGLAIFPIVFTYHLSPAGGPGLMFEILPIAFSHMQGGALGGALFFLLLLFAGWTSAISLAEPLVVLLIERYRLPRVTAAMAVGGLAWALGLVSLLSFNVWKHVLVLHHWTLFAFITDMTTNVMLPLGSGFFAIFVGWVMCPKNIEAVLHLQRSFFWSFWRFLLRYIAPVGVLMVFVASLWGVI